MGKARNDMDGDTAREAEKLYGDISPLEAMSRLDYIITTQGTEAFLQNPESKKIAKAVAAMDDAQIRNWVSSQVQDNNAQGFEFYHKRALDFRNRCRRAGGWADYKSEVH